MEITTRTSEGPNSLANFIASSIFRGFSKVRSLLQPCFQTEAQRKSTGIKIVAGVWQTLLFSYIEIYEKMLSQQLFVWKYDISSKFSENYKFLTPNFILLNCYFELNHNGVRTFHPIQFQPLPFQPLTISTVDNFNLLHFQPKLILAMAMAIAMGHKLFMKPKRIKTGVKISKFEFRNV